MCFIAMTTVYPFSVTEKNHMERLYGILPLRKSELVVGRYIYVISLGMTALIISLIAQDLGESVYAFNPVNAPFPPDPVRLV